MPSNALIAVNKTDLQGADKLFTNIFNKYKDLPYQVLKTNKDSSSDLHELSFRLQNKTCIFVGQSGVGKSTIINHLVPNIDIETQEISDHLNAGKHTTSTTTLYDLPAGGEIIDSPGVRDFTIPELDSESIVNGFVEIEKLGRKCKFNNCKHINEPNCYVKYALENKQINQDRYEAYKTLYESKDGETNNSN